MSFFNSFRRAFGIGGEYSDDDFHDSDLQETEESMKNASEEETGNELGKDFDDKGLASDIMEEVIRLFNSTQPEFVKSCLNTEQQKKRLYESLDESIKLKIRTAIEHGHDEGRRLWEAEKQSLSEEIDRLKKDIAEFQQKREESKGALLSAERQKRAMNERIRDLESQTAKMAAENEQLGLENRSLLNKLRVAGVTGVAGSADDNVKKELESKIAELEEQLKFQSGLLEKAKTFTNDTSEKDDLIERLTSDLSKATAEKERIDQALKTAEKTIEEQAKELETAMYIKDQVDKIEQSLSKKEELIGKVKNEKRELRERLAELETQHADNLKEVTRLKEELEAQKTVNLKNLEVLKNYGDSNKTDSESVVKKEESHDSNDSTPELKRETSQKQKRRGRPKRHRNGAGKNDGNEITKSHPVISAIDDLLDSNDWFVAPDPSEFVKEPSEPEDFGYKPPQRKNNDDLDDKQLSLF